MDFQEIIRDCTLRLQREIFGDVLSPFDGRDFPSLTDAKAPRVAALLPPHQNMSPITLSANPTPEIRSKSFRDVLGSRLLSPICTNSTRMTTGQDSSSKLRQKLAD